MRRRDCLHLKKILRNSSILEAIEGKGVKRKKKRKKNQVLMKDSNILAEEGENLKNKNMKKSLSSADNDLSKEGEKKDRSLASNSRMSRKRN